MIINKCTTELEKLKSMFDEYEQTIDTIILNAKKNTDHTVITKGRIHNYTPFHEERLGFKLKAELFLLPLNPMIASKSGAYYRILFYPRAKSI